MVSDEKFDKMALIGAIAAAAVVGGVLFALYPNNYSGSGNNQNQQYSTGAQTYNANPSQTSTASQNAGNATSQGQNATSVTPPQQSSGSSSAGGSGH